MEPMEAVFWSSIKAPREPTFSEKLFAGKQLKEEARLRRALSSRPDDIGPHLLGNAPNGFSAGSGQAVRVGSRLYGELFSAALHWYDAPLSEWHEEQLGRVAKLFGLPGGVVGRIRKRVGRQEWPSVVRQLLDLAVEDSEIDVFDHQALPKTVGFAGQRADNIYRTAARERIQEEIAEAVDDYSLSPQEAARIKSLLRLTGVDAGLSREQAGLFELAAFNWLLENGELDAVDAPIDLKKGEECYFGEDVEWFELRKQAKGRTIRYHGVSARIRLAGGVFYRFGELDVSTPPLDTVLTQIDAGTLYVTNRRIIYDGEAFNRTYRHTELLRVDQLPFGVRLEREKGRSPVLSMSSTAAGKVASLVAWFGSGQAPAHDLGMGSSEFFELAPSKRSPKKASTGTMWFLVSLIVLLLFCCIGSVALSLVGDAAP